MSVTSHPSAASNDNTRVEGGVDVRVGVDPDAADAHGRRAPRRRNPGSRSSMPVTRPATSRAMGPMVSKLGESGQTPSRGIRPHVVLSPAVPQHAEGIRTEPPVSLP